MRCLAFIGLQLERAPLTERLVEVDVLLFAQRLDVEFEHVTKQFRAIYLDEREHIFA